MIKRFILAAMLLMGIAGAKAQMEQPLQLNPNVLHGTLPNGLNYYILHNEEPKNRANFYIAQKVGSSLETPEQLGLAHFLEHMAFNGTKNFPGKTMLDYLQSKGIKFGADINAYTNFDETVYNIDNVNTSDQALMDSVLLVLHDWSGSILLDEAEIDAERGVIEGEYISRNNADFRMYTAILPKIFAEYQYEQMPIGKMEIIKHFPYQVLRDYYKKWYRPDLQGIVIVGDFDAHEMEQKVKALFSQIPMPQNAAARVYPTISDNEKPIYVTFEDPELQMPRVDTYFKFDVTPIEIRNTVIGYAVDNLAFSMIQRMINNRLSEYQENPDCPYSYAGVRIGNFMVTDLKNAFQVMVIPKDSYETAYAGAMGIVAQACKTGFMGTEAQRVRDQILSEYETKYNERDKTKSETLARQIIEHFINNEPAPGIEKEYELVSQLLPALPIEFYNELASQLLHIENTVVVISQPKTISLNIPAENALISQLNDIINADYEPYVDEEITEPLVSALPQAGTIVSEKENIELGLKEYTLSNGMKVVVKPTDFANDEVLFEIFRQGGKASYPSSEAVDVLGQELVLETCNIGPFSPTQLNKYLAGKKVSLNYKVGSYTNFFNGNSTKKDLASMFELIYASFTDVTPNEDTFTSAMNQIKAVYANQMSNPQFIFQQKVDDILYPEALAMHQPTLATFEAMNLENLVKLYRESVANAADYTVTIVGNVDENELKPLLAQYLATLPSTGLKSEPARVTTVTPATGKQNDKFDIASQSPTVYLFETIWQDGMEFNARNYVMVDYLSDVLSMIFLETLREEMGGTYSPMAWATLNPYSSSWEVGWFVVTNEEVMTAITDRANAEFVKLLSQGTDLEHFSKVREAAIKSYENEVRTNKYWQRGLLYYENGFNHLQGVREAYDTITLDDFNAFVGKLYNGKNKIEILGVAK